MSSVPLRFRIWMRNGIFSLLKKAMLWDRPPSSQHKNRGKDHYIPMVAEFGLWDFFFLSSSFFFPFFPPSPAWLFLQGFTIPVCVWAGAFPAGTLSSISKITIFTVLTFLPSSMVLTVLGKEMSKTFSSALTLNMALLLFKKIRPIYLENMFFFFHISKHLLPNCFHSQDRAISVHFLTVQSTISFLLWKSNR